MANPPHHKGGVANRNGLERVLYPQLSTLVILGKALTRGDALLKGIWALTTPCSG